MNIGIAERRRQILVVDDEFVNREMLGFILNTKYEVIYAENGRQAIEILQKKGREISLMVLDLLMPEMDGFEVLELRGKDEHLSEIPVIVLTSEDGAELRSLKMGATDFIKKPYDMPEIILARVDRIVELTEDRRTIVNTEREALTGLYTREYFYEYVIQRESFFPRRVLDVGALNLEKFHLVNEIYGRSFGDHVLRTVAGILQDFLKENGGICCRSESDHFLIYFDYQKNYDSLMAKLQSELDTRIPEIQIRMRLGIYTSQDHNIPIEQRCDQAKIACDTLRNDYTKNVAFYDAGIHEKSLLSLQLINEVDQAIREHQLQVFYQPKFGIQGDKPVLKCAEALVRWVHPVRGMINPGVFIPLFENNGLIQKVDYYVWSKAAAQVREWKEAFGVSVPVSVNVSRIDLYDPQIENKLVKIRGEYGLSEEEMHLEVTESAYVENQTEIVETVQHLRSAGFPIEMDDFGSGYSSLALLTTLPINVLKLDMKLIRNIHKDERSMNLVRSILNIAHLMNFSTVAEGVEEAEQVKILKEAGCDEIQGWYYSRPVPAQEFTKFILAEKEDKKC